MNVRAKIIITSIDLDKKESKCFYYKYDFITKRIDSNVEDIHKTLQKSLSSFFEIDSDWVKFKIVDIIKENNYLYIYYTCLIPQAIKIKKGKWLDIGKMNEKHTDLVFKSLQQII